MPDTIVDGKGTGTKARVDEQNRLHVHAYDIPIEVSSTLAGDSFLVNTPIITLTSDNESGIFYIDNTSNDDILATFTFFAPGTSTGGASAFHTVTNYTNPAGGTLITAGNTITPTNNRFGDSNQLDATVLSGSEGATITGSSITRSFVADDFQSTVSIAIAPGVSFAVSITPSTGNTSLPLSYGLIVIGDASIYGGTL